MEFSKLLDDFSFDNFIPSEETPDKYSFLVCTIIDAINQINAPYTSNTKVKNKNKNKNGNQNSKPPQPPWWNRDCIEAEEKRKTALKNFRRNPNLLTELIESEKSAKEIFQKSKKESFIKFCEQISPFTPPSLVWDTIKRFRHRALAASAARNNLKNINSMKQIILTSVQILVFFPIFQIRSMLRTTQ